jgi:signal transduction histidine kinase
LDKVTDRFSKIGSKAKLSEENLNGTIEQVLGYLRPRISKKVEMTFTADAQLLAPHNGPLMEWVIENVVKNAVDAMEAKGNISIHLHETQSKALIDIKDNGKGLPTKLQKRVFEPGFSTKKRGWGLGLSLVKRIVSDYHKGSIFVLESEPNKGATFRIVLPLKSV